MALGGIMLSVATWATFAWIESIVQDTTVRACRPRAPTRRGDAPALDDRGGARGHPRDPDAVRPPPSPRAASSRRAGAHPADVRGQSRRDRLPGLRPAGSSTRTRVPSRWPADPVLAERRVDLSRGRSGGVAEPCPDCRFEEVATTGELSPLDPARGHRRDGALDRRGHLPGVRPDGARSSPASFELRDITELRLAERALQRSHEELEVRVDERTRELVSAERRCWRRRSPGTG